MFVGKISVKFIQLNHLHLNVTISFSTLDLWSERRKLQKILQTQKVEGEKVQHPTLIV